MFKNYLKIAVRNLLKHKGYFSINIIGLSAGMACCLLILLWVRDELSYDRFHRHAERIYRVALKARINNKDIVSAYSCAPLAKTLAADFPEVEHSTTVFRPENVTIRWDEKTFNEKNFFYTDPGFFEVFTVPLLKGDKQTALAEPRAVVLTQSMALKYFGAADPMGQTLVIDGKEEYLVTAVCQEVPPNSHLHYDFLASWQTLEDSRNPIWVGNDNYTYCTLRAGVAARDLETKFPVMVRKYAGPQFEAAGLPFDKFLAAGGIYGYFLQPLTSIHLHSHLEHEVEPTGDMVYVYIFSIIAFFILLIGCINFMNLATARSAGRAREVGVRKVLGSHVSQLARLFLTESVLVSCIAAGLAVVVVESLLSNFNSLAGKALTIDFFGNGLFLAVVLVGTLLVGLLAGSYPAFFLSSFQPISVLKGRLASGFTSGRIRSILVIFQFAISIALIVSIVVVYKQMSYVQHKKLGFNKEHVVIIDNVWLLGNQRQSFKQELLKSPGVAGASLSRTVPGLVASNSAFQLEGSEEGTPSLLWMIRTDFDFVETLGIEMASGRSFSSDFSTDSSAVVLNESAARLLGVQDAVGKRLIRVGQPIKHEIIGIARDFHFESLHQPIRPLVILIEGQGDLAVVRIQPNRIGQTMQALEKIWETFAAGQPFVHTFLDQEFEALYRTEQRIGTVVALFAGLAVAIACMGLLGLVAFATEQRTKEIGIRKVLGASVPNIVMMLCNDFLRLILYAIVVATPFAYVVMNRWLEDFAYRTAMSWWVFAFSGGLALLIALLTVSTQAIKAALANPVVALRYE
jgi:putative ABC transport system permease protein